MIYVFPISTPANTLEAAKQKTVLPLARGRIIGLQVHFPSGHLGLTHIAVNAGLHQFWPTNPEAAFSSSGEAIVWAEDFYLDTPPYQLEAYTWNEDDTYAHLITVRVVLESLPLSTSSLAAELAKLLTPLEASNA